MRLQQPCPCGSGATYDACCGRLHRGGALAQSAEELMCSRYAAYATGELDYVFRTWWFLRSKRSERLEGHPRTRPDDLSPDPSLTWTDLQIIDAGETAVEFVASYLRGGVVGRRHERSRFERRGGRWVYVDGDLLP